MAESRTIGALLAWARRSLDHAGVGNATQEAVWLLSHALGRQNHCLTSEAESPVSAQEWARGESLVSRRMAREPLQYILGTQEFCGLEFHVNPAVLIPRPETELLIQEVVRRCAVSKSVTLVDVATGSGCVAITLATILNGMRILGLDRFPEALAVAKSNAERHAVSDKIEWLEGDLLSPLRDKGMAGAVDVIVSNPPYIAEAEWAGLEPEVRVYEPRLALIAGQKGTELHERLLHDSMAYLVPGGLLVVEIGQGQAAAIRQVAAQLGGYAALRVVEDASGIERVVIAERLG